MSGRRSSPRPRVVLVFGEDDNDRRVLQELVSAVRPDAPRLVARRRPLVLVKGATATRARSNADDIAAVVRAEAVDHDVRGVVAHQDCDACEPADEALAQRIEALLAERGVTGPVAATPAWEVEAWFWLWPDAVARVNTKWRRLKRSGNVGRIEHAKEWFRRDLRQEGASDYRESDAPRIAQQVRADGIETAASNVTNPSWTRFVARVLAAPW